MTQEPSIPPRLRRRLLARVTLRVFATSTAVVALYFILPMSNLGGVPVAVPLVVGLLLLTP